MKTEDKICKNCAFCYFGKTWQYKVNNLYYCKRHSPTRMDFCDTTYISTPIYMMVDENDWCGDFYANK